MPATLLFDTSAVNFDNVAIDADQVGSINPQCGDMRQLDHVVWINDSASEIIGVKHVKDDEFWVDGHIPGRPLLPGVLMIEAAAQLCSVLYRQRTQEERFIGFTRCDDTIFRGQVIPGDTLHLLAKEIQFRPRRLICACQGIVDDNLVLETKITGMVL